MHGRDWAITEAGIEYRPAGAVMIAEHEFPEDRARMTSTHLNGWSRPRRREQTPQSGSTLWHLPVRHGPLVSQPTWRPSKTMPQTTAE
jgi:hypothetical protein